MFNNKYKTAKKEITQIEPFYLDSDGKALITIKALERDQIFSSYEYDSSEKLNDVLASFIEDKIKLVPVNNDVKIKIYTDKNVKPQEVKNAIKLNYKREYFCARSQNFKNWLFAGAMFLLGAIFLSLLLVSIKFLNNQFIDTILEIFSWVFLWEMVDAIFLKRSHIRLEMMRYLRIYCAEIEVINLNKTEKIQKKQIKKLKK